MTPSDSSSGPPSSPPGRESRKSERVTINKEFASFDAFLQEYVTNISADGVFIRSKTPLPIGTRVNLLFTVIMDDIETVEGVGEVVRISDDPPGMGVVFREVSKHSKAILERLLTRPLRGRAMPRTAAALIIGNELLSGKVVEGNLHGLAVCLRQMGVQLRRVVMVLDEVDTIANEVKALAGAHDWLFTSGGVGPTHDDVTMEAVAKAFGVPVTMHPEMERMLREHYGAALKEGHLRMALVPEGAEMRASDAVRWPVTVFRNVWIMPGVPEIFRMKLPLIEEALGTDVPYLSRAVYTNMDEGTLKPLLDAVVSAYPDVDVGSYPTWSDPSYRTKLTFDGKDPARVEEAMNAFVRTLPSGEPLRIA